MDKMVLGIVCFVAGFLVALSISRTFFRDPPIRQNEWGTFSSTPRVELLDDGRKLRLLEDFAFIDPRNRFWVAEKGAIVDGASIPRIFWTMIGGPLEGPYRNASIVHDVECVAKAKPSDDVHRMYYEACRCAGVSELTAKVMYWAVCNFGPRWGQPVFENQERTDSTGTRRPFRVLSWGPRAEMVGLSTEHGLPVLTAELVVKMKTFVQKNNPSLEELRTLSPDKL